MVTQTPCLIRYDINIKTNEVLTITDSTLRSNHPTTYLGPVPELMHRRIWKAQRLRYSLKAIIHMWRKAVCLGKAMKTHTGIIKETNIPMPVKPAKGS